RRLAPKRRATSQVTRWLRRDTPSRQRNHLQLSRPDAAVAPGAFAHALDMLIAHRLLEAAEPGEAKTVSRGNRRDLAHAGDIDFLADGIVFETPFESQRHRFSHAGIGFAGWETEVETKVDRSRHFNHAAFDHQHVVTFGSDAPGDISRPRDITDDRARLEVMGFDYGVDGAGHRQDQVSIVNGF